MNFLHGKSKFWREVLHEAACLTWVPEPLGRKKKSIRLREKENNIPGSRIENRSAFHFCIASGNSNWQIYQESDFISAESHLICYWVERVLVWVGCVGVGLRKWSRISKESFMSPFPLGDSSSKHWVLCYDTWAGNSSFQSSGTCTVSGHAPPGFQSPLIPFLATERGK